MAVIPFTALMTAARKRDRVRRKSAVGWGKLVLPVNEASMRVLCRDLSNGRRPRIEVGSLQAVAAHLHLDLFYARPKSLQCKTPPHQVPEMLREAYQPVYWRGRPWPDCGMPLVSLPKSTLTGTRGGGALGISRKSLDAVLAGEPKLLLSSQQRVVWGFLGLVLYAGHPELGLARVQLPGDGVMEWARELRRLQGTAHAWSLGAVKTEV